MPLTPQQIEHLKQLKDIHLPDPIGWWPLSSTWWIIVILVGVIIVGAIWVYFEQKKRNAYRAEALALIQTILLDSKPAAENSPSQKIRQINHVLKQVALTAYGRAQVAQLSDQDWLDFLKKKASYISQPEQLIDDLRLAYQPPSTTPEALKKHQEQLVEWSQYAQKWIKGHHQ
ncbi:MAG: DUF4381 domain-containing protein [Gammaproteobacteria bacterium]|nr:DUF4381 domain-containing protein [Gammaproteobacteria bacterium]